MVRIKYGRNDYYVESETGGEFFCRACLRSLPLSKRSAADLRYCAFCQGVIAADNALREAPQKPAEPLLQRRELFANSSPDQTPAPEPEIAKTKVKIRRGPYRKSALPEELIRQLRGEGMILSAIADELSRQGLSVSMWTVRRVLNGSRSQPLEMGLR